jgi:hypothetical protein
LLLLTLWAGRYSARIAWIAVRWKAHIWLPTYLTTASPDASMPDDCKHVIFVIADHYEPGTGPRGTETHENWLARFRPISDRHRDSFGNRFRYTWFYPYDHHNEDVLVSLCRAAYEGYGEVELHWHLPRDMDKDSFPTMLQEAIAWFQQYGALVSSGPERRTAFAYVAGNWALDGALPKHHGVTNQLDVLFSQGCYADFTFSTIGTVCQPRKCNAIYYVTDTDEPKSYDDGTDARVGQSIDDRLMIFQGPIGIDWKWHTCGLEYGAVESFALPTERRIRHWIDTNIHVVGRPEWVFVKVHTHGCQSAEEIVGRDLDKMLTWLEEICHDKRIALHYMTAREAYNVVKAAEDRKSGNPEDYRDYRIPKPRNMLWELR